MIIRKLYIENFGHFHDFTLELGPGLNRLRKENEFGKTTLFEFVRRVLWGYPDGRKSQNLNRYPARFNAGEYGGYLDVELADGTRARLERYGLKGKLVVRRPDGRMEDGDEFLRRLTPVSGDCYRNVYAVTLDELTLLSSLDGDEIRGRLYGGAITGAGVSLPALGKHFDDRAKELFKQRGTASEIGAARQELRDANEKRDRALAESARRPALERELAELERESSQLRADAANVRTAVAESDQLLKAYPLRAKLAETDAALAAVPPGNDVPEEPARRAEELTELLARTPPAPSADPARTALLAAEAALLDRELAASGGNEPLPAGEDHRTAGELAERCAAATDAPAFPPPVWVFAALAVAFAAAFCFRPPWRLPHALAVCFRPPWHLSLAAAAVVFALAAAYGWWVFLRRRAEHARRAGELARELTEFQTRLKLDCPPEKFSSVLKARERRREAEKELAALQEAQRAHDRVEGVKRELADLCRRFGCADAPQMRQQARRTAEVASLRRRRAETAAALDALLPKEKQSRLDGFDPGAERSRRAAAAARVAELEQAVFLLHQKSGAIANELEHLPRGGEVELLDSEIARAKCTLRRLAHDYLVVRLCRALLDAAVDRYERESQPEVFKSAEKLFSDFTDGRYDHLYKKLATGELTVHDRATGQEKTFTALSRGTREELMLAMRLGLIECTERDTEVLPVCFDDVGVNFDSARLGRVEKAVAEFARKRQVIWLSHS